MAEKPILFSGEMVRAILDGRKTQTRRVVTRGTVGRMMRSNQRLWPYLIDEPVACPYGEPGDLLWVRETWASHILLDGEKPSQFTEQQSKTKIWYRADKQLHHEDQGKWRPSIFMPRWASRITLEVSGVYVERLWDMTIAKMGAEGVREIPESNCHPLTPFITLWDSINAKRGYSWESNPWVWVIEFEVSDD